MTSVAAGGVMLLALGVDVKKRHSPLKKPSACTMCVRAAVLSQLPCRSCQGGKPHVCNPGWLKTPGKLIIAMKMEAVSAKQNFPAPDTMEICPVMVYQMLQCCYQSWLFGDSYPAMGLSVALKTKAALGWYYSDMTWKQFSKILPTFEQYSRPLRGPR
ncbi:hypothetical protein IWX49DRAFT_268254 [Phyllosticta citricarpa]